MLSFKQAIKWLGALILGWLIVLSTLFIIDAYQHGLWQIGAIRPATAKAIIFNVAT